MKFVKMQGCGNDYIYIREEDLLKIPEAEWVRYVRFLCDRHFGVGADGVIVIRTLDGKNAILKAMNLEEGATAKERNNQIGGHKA